MKKSKHQTQQDIDTIINEGEIPTEPERLPGRIFNKQNHHDFIAYADMLNGDEKKYNETMTGPPTSSQNTNINII